MSGLAGDFFVVMRQMDVYEAIIWFCVKSRDESISGEPAPGDPAIWVLIGFNPDIAPRNGGSSALL